MRVLVFCSISQVQQTDAGEYRCRLVIDTKIIESQPIVMEVEGEIQV